MKTLTAHLKPKFIARAAALCLVFTLANPSGIALAQARRVLIVEHIEKPGKVKLLLERDKLILGTANPDAEVTGRIKAFTDSSVFLADKEYLIRDIRYIRSPSDGKLFLKGLGWSFIPIGALGMADAISPEPWLHGHIHAIAFGGLALSTFLITRKTKTRQFGPETGWRFRMKTIRQQ